MGKITNEQIILLETPIKELGLSLGLQEHIRNIYGAEAKLKDLCYIYNGNYLSYEDIQRNIITDPVLIQMEAAKHVYKGKTLISELLEIKKQENNYQRYYNEIIEYLTHFNFKFIEDMEKPKYNFKNIKVIK